jgi:hypothetical protein
VITQKEFRRIWWQYVHLMDAPFATQQFARLYG